MTKRAIEEIGRQVFFRHVTRERYRPFSEKWKMRVDYYPAMIVSAWEDGLISLVVFSRNVEGGTFRRTGLLRYPGGNIPLEDEAWWESYVDEIPESYR